MNRPADTSRTPPAASSSAPAAAEPVRPPYQAPAIAWEDDYVALAQISPPPCIPGQDPRCTP